MSDPTAVAATLVCPNFAGLRPPYHDGSGNVLPVGDFFRCQQCGRLFQLFEGQLVGGAAAVGSGYNSAAYDAARRQR